MAVQCSKTPETIYQATRCHTAEDQNMSCHIIPTFTPWSSKQSIFLMRSG